MTRRLTLDDRGKQYLLSQTYGDDTFSKAAACVVAGPGEVWTWLPDGVRSERAYAFTTGGYIPANEVNRLQRTSPMVRVVSYNDQLVIHIHAALAVAPDTICIIEHPALKPGQGPPEIRAKTFSFEEHVYFVLNAASSVEDVYFAVRYAKTPWRMLGVIGHNSTVVAVDLRQALQNIEQVFSIAYDMEGFVFCQRSNSA